MSNVLYYANQKSTPNQMSRHVRTYQPSVRVGNWNEDIYLEEDLLKDFLHKKDNGLLSIQLSANLTATYDSPLPTSTSFDGYIHFGDHVMLKNMGAPDDELIAMGGIRREDSTLTLNAEAERMQTVTKVDWVCGVSATKKCSPTPRNTFTIVPIEDWRTEKSIIRFGEPFMLMPRAGSGLHLNVNAKTLSIYSKHSRHHEVNLVPDKTRNAHWQFLHIDPRLRFEYEGIPVPANEVLVINHINTNMRLNVEDQHVFRTAFGRDYEVAAYTSLDTHKVETATNRWIVVMGTTADESPLFKAFNETKKMSNEKYAREAANRQTEGAQPDDVPQTTVSDPAPVPEYLTQNLQDNIENAVNSPSQNKLIEGAQPVINEAIHPSTIPANPFP